MLRRRAMATLLATILLTGTGRAPVSAQPAAGTHPPQQRLFTVDEVETDFADLYRTLQRAHFNLYENVTRGDYDRLFDQMSAEIAGPHSRQQVAERFQRFVAYGRIAHARIDAAFGRYSEYRDAGGRVFPLTLRFEGRRAFILENRGGQAEPSEGSEILTIDGVAIGTWFDRTTRHLSADSDYLAGSLLEFYFARLLWLEVGAEPSFTVRYRSNGQIRTALVPARSRAEIDAVERPGRLRLDPDGRTARMLEPGIGYLRPGPFYNNVPDAKDMYDNRAFVAFIDRSFESFITDGARALIVDLRDNPGGDNSFSDHLVAWFATRPFRFASDFRIRVSPETTASNAARLRTSTDQADNASARMARLYAGARSGDVVPFGVNEGRPRAGRQFRGHVYLLVDRHSYSNAVNLAALVQDYGFGKIVGEETSDLATTLGAMESFTLPRTQIQIGYPKAQIIRASGSRVRRGVVPDIPILTPIVQHESDPVLQRATVIARQGRSQ